MLLDNNDAPNEQTIPDDVEEILRLQDEAMALLSRLRTQEPWQRPREDHGGGGRRDFRRWPVPPGVSLQIHSGLAWESADCMDMGVGGARLGQLPAWVKGPVPARLQSGDTPAVLVLADVMWKEKNGPKAGLRFEFQDEDERDHWGGELIDALLAAHSLV